MKQFNKSIESQKLQDPSIVSSQKLKTVIPVIDIYLNTHLNFLFCMLGRELCERVVNQVDDHIFVLLKTLQYKMVNEIKNGQ